MAEVVPAIRVTDPHSKETPPSLPQSPQRDGGTGWDGVFKRPTTPVSRRDASTDSSRPSSPQNQARNSTHNTGSQNSRPATQNGDTPYSPSASPVDPLTQQILKRTRPSSGTPNLLHPTSPDPAGNEGRSHADRPAIDERTPVGPPQRTDSGLRSPKEKKKGVSFLSRIIGSKKKDVAEDVPDDTSEYSETRPEGAAAQVFAQAINNIEYNPKHPPPPAYIKVRAKNQTKKHFDRLFLAQELQPDRIVEQKSHTGKTTLRKRSMSELDQGTIWSMEWSKDGKYLATAGHDKIVRIWAVLSSAEERHEEQRRNSASSAESMRDSLRLSAPVFRSKPVREFHGHTAAILDLSWSKNNFLLSSSMDKTVRLWHISRPECLCTFKHADFVVSAAFHPKDDRFFLAGSLDCKLRLWSIPDKSVAYWSQLPEMITAVCFTPDGKHCIAGGLTGRCMFYETEGLKYQTQIHVRSTHGKNAKGSKITSIQAVQHPPGSATGDVKLVITSNDSRVRLYNFRDKALETKLKGCQNTSSQIRGAISDDHRYAFCGSEDHRAFIWHLSGADSDDGDKRPVEMFQAGNTVLTCVSFAPARSRLLLGKSEDPIYDLCNPPPVTLVSRAERAASQTSSKAPTENADPSHAAANRPDLGKATTHESESRTARSTHNEGNIIVTADFSGHIKVFRQDCAGSKRRPQEHRDHHSGLSRRMGSLTASRSASMRTTASKGSLRSGRDSVSTQAPSERIMSWRQGISSTGNVRTGSLSSKRSISPRKSVSQMSIRSNQTKPESNLRSPATVTTDSLVSADTSTEPGTPSSKRNERFNNGHGVLDSPQDKSNGTEAQWQVDPPPSNPLMLEGERSNMFWSVEAYRREAERARHSAQQKAEQDHVSGSHTNGLGPPQRSSSYVSQLSIERAGSSPAEGSDDGGQRSSR